MKTIKRIISIISVFVLCIGTASVPLSAVTSADFYESRYENILTVPYSENITFSHAKSSDGLSHSILDSRVYAFRAEEGCIIGVLFQKGAVSSDGQAAKSAVSATIYNDTGDRIAQAETDSDGNDGAHIEFIPAYTGIYYVELSSRSAAAGEYASRISIHCAKKYQKSSISKFPHSFNYSKNTHKTLTLSELFQSDEYTKLGIDTNISIIEFAHDAGSIFSYKLNSPDKSAIPSGRLLCKKGDIYTARDSENGDSYASGDAAELGYSGTSYLIVYSNGTFTLSADVLAHEKYVIYELESDFCGKLDVSNSSLMYDPQKISELITQFPFSDIKNREVVFFKLNCEPSSVVSYLCDRREHKFFTLVSDEFGLSPDSSHPLRHYGSYCSEVSPSKLCYNAYISDSGSAYLCYTGTDTYSYIELYTNKTHAQSVTFDPKYKPGTPLPSIEVSDIYNDSAIYEKLGTEKHIPDAVRIGGYYIIGTEGERYYYSSDASLTVPDEHGTLKMYALICAVYNSGTQNEISRYHSVYIGDIEADKGFLLPIIEDIVDYIAENPQKSTLLIVCISIPVIAGVIILVILIKKKRATQKATPTPDKSNQDETHSSDDKGKGGV